jgi:protein O-GlcNAc transferase
MIRTEELVKEAEEQLALGNLAEAYTLFEQAHNEEASSRRESPAAAIGLARVAILLGQPENAIALLDKVLAAFPKSAEAVNYRGVALEALGELDRAVKEYKRAAKLDPKLAVARFNLGRAYGLQKRWKEAVKELRTAVRQDPGVAAYHYSLGIACQESGDTAGAIEAFSDCVEADPVDLDPQMTLADVLVSAGREDLAEQILDNARTLYPEEGAIYAALAALRLRVGDPAGAGGLLRLQTEATPQDLEAWLNLNLVALAVLDLQTAERSALRAVELAPEDWRGHYQLGMVYDAGNLKDKAEAAWRTAIEKAPLQWQPYNNLGTLLMEKSDDASWDEAARCLEAALSLGPTAEPHVAFYNLALVSWKLGRTQKSKLAAQAAVDLGPEGDAVTADARRFLGNFEA